MKVFMSKIKTDMVEKVREALEERFLKGDVESISFYGKSALSRPASLA